MKSLLLGSRETIAGTVYGTIVVLAAFAAGAKAYRDDLWALAATAVAGVLVLWIAHVYSHGLGESLREGHRLTAGELRSIARRELSIPLAAVLPVGVLVLGAVDLLRDGTALWLAFGVGVGVLTIEGIRYARLERLGRWAAIASVATNVALGLTIVGLKVVANH